MVEETNSNSSEDKNTFINNLLEVTKQLKKRTSIRGEYTSSYLFYATSCNKINF